MKPRPKAATRAVQTAPDDGLLALDLFDRFFRGPTWAAWRAFVCAVFGLSMAADEQQRVASHTGRSTFPIRMIRRICAVIGRRAGKTRMWAFVMTFCAAVRTYPNLAPGERAVVQAICPDRRQAAVLLNYCEAFLRDLPGVEIVRRTQEEIELGNGISIVVQTANFRSVRGYTIVCCVIDEAAFLRADDSASPDSEIVRAVLPALASSDGLLILGSSPYAQRGELFNTFERYWGVDDSPVLVWQADTRSMNPTIPQGVVDRAYEEDPASANAEFGAVFRADLEELFTRAALDAVVVGGRFELRPLSGTAYVAFVDPSGGSADSFTLAISHRDHTSKAVLDLMREVKPPFSPEAVCQQFATELKRYGVRVTYSDSYAAEWPREQFTKHGITVQPSPLTRSEIYLELLPTVNSGACELLDNPRLLNQLASLERRTGRTGKDAVDHPRGSHDDLANAAGGALVMAVRSIGLKAALPATFTECANSIAAGRCAFLYTSPWFPDDAQCRRECAGLRAVRGVYQQQRQAAAASGEPILSAREFLDQHFDLESSPLTGRAAWGHAIRDLENELGL